MFKGNASILQMKKQQVYKSAPMAKLKISKILVTSKFVFFYFAPMETMFQLFDIGNTFIRSDMFCYLCRIDVANTFISISGFCLSVFQTIAKHD